MSEHPTIWREFHTPKWVAGGAVGVLVLWFSWLYPLVPVTTVGWVAAVGSGLIVGVWAVLCISAVLWLRRQSQFVWVCKLAGILIAVSLGAGIFATAYFLQVFLTQNFSYFGR